MANYNVVNPGYTPAAGIYPEQTYFEDDVPTYKGGAEICFIYREDIGNGSKVWHLRPSSEEISLYFCNQQGSNITDFPPETGWQVRNGAFPPAPTVVLVGTPQLNRGETTFVQWDTVSSANGVDDRLIKNLDTNQILYQRSGGGTPAQNGWNMSGWLNVNSVELDGGLQITVPVGAAAGNYYFEFVSANCKHSANFTLAVVTPTILSFGVDVYDYDIQQLTGREPKQCVGNGISFETKGLIGPVTFTFAGGVQSQYVEENPAYFEQLNSDSDRNFSLLVPVGAQTGPITVTHNGATLTTDTFTPLHVVPVIGAPEFTQFQAGGDYFANVVNVNPLFGEPVGGRSDCNGPIITVIVEELINGSWVFLAESDMEQGETSVLIPNAAGRQYRAFVRNRMFDYVVDPPPIAETSDGPYAYYPSPAPCTEAVTPVAPVVTVSNQNNAVVTPYGPLPDCCDSMVLLVKTPSSNNLFEYDVSLVDLPVGNYEARWESNKWIDAILSSILGPSTAFTIAASSAGGGTSEGCTVYQVAGLGNGRFGPADGDYIFDSTDGTQRPIYRRNGNGIYLARVGSYWRFQNALDETAENTLAYNQSSSMTPPLSGYQTNGYGAPTLNCTATDQAGSGSGSGSGIGSGSGSGSGTSSSGTSGDFGSGPMDGSGTSTDSGSGSSDGSGTSIGSGSGRECWQAPEPDIVPESQTLDGFSVQAPPDVPSGVLLQLELKKDGEAGFNRIGEPVGADGIVTVDGREPCTWYWVRWVQAS